MPQDSEINETEAEETEDSGSDDGVVAEVEGDRLERILTKVTGGAAEDNEDEEGEETAEEPEAPAAPAPATPASAQAQTTAEAIRAAVEAALAARQAQAPATPQLPPEAQEAMALRQRLQEAIDTDAFAVLEVLGIEDPAAFVRAIAEGKGPADPGRKSREEAKALKAENERLLREAQERADAEAVGAAEAEARQAFDIVAKASFPELAALGRKAYDSALRWARQEAAQGRQPTYEAALKAQSDALFVDLDTVMKIPQVRARYGLPAEQGNGSQAQETARPAKKTRPKTKPTAPQPPRNESAEDRLERAMRRAGAQVS